ncbi:MAG: hydrogenase formation protein HypD [Candidatus Omnitrophica bacterium]|nr:hydrogenase formation protein HypD [Candidatus Omnitrophota bacterium]
MEHIEKFRNPDYIKALVLQIHTVSKKIKKEVKLMEVCGTHTMAIARWGIRKMLPENVSLISGPGCPVCVTPNQFIDTAIEISKLGNVKIATFGDMYRVPSGKKSLEKQSANGAVVDIVYSPLDALKIAEKNPEKKIVFLAVGFETTSPLTAKVILYARNRKLKNFFVLSGHKLIPPAMVALVKDKTHHIDGFLCPGHVSAIIGSEPYRVFPNNYGVPCVISGFEVCDILQSILMLLEMICGKRKLSVEIQYTRCVRRYGNTVAQRIIADVFNVVDVDWRGIGMIEQSGLAINRKFTEFDAFSNFKLDVKISSEAKSCICGQILKGLKTPLDCKLYRRLCTPESPIGPCMVSSEGTCAAYYNYER